MGKGKDGALECCVTACVASCFCLRIILIIAFIGLGIAKIAMGGHYLRDCSIEDMIPIWLILSGCAPVLFSGFRRGNSPNSDRSELGRRLGLICGVFGLVFHLVWLICGSVWVYPNYITITADDFRPCSRYFTADCTRGNCDKSLITFAVAMASLDWIIVGLIIALIACNILLTCYVSDSEGPEDRVEDESGSALKENIDEVPKEEV